MRKLIPFLQFFLTWAIELLLVTFVALTIYVTVQQNFRQSAYDPQIQMSEDLAASGSRFVSTEQVDVSKSLAPFVIIFDDNRQVSTSSGWLNGKIPIPPPGVFAYTRVRHQDRFTWQPQDDIRIATIVTKSNTGFVLVGRNMREVENRIENLLVMIGGSWLLAASSTFVLTLLLFLTKRVK